MRKIIVDTDIGSDIDDALCLTYLLKREDVKVCGITTVAGESERRAQMASVICRHLGKDVPIYVGASRPLCSKGRVTGATQALAIGKWAHDTSFPDVHAVEFMRRTIEGNIGEVELLAIGPLTNIALLFSMYPHTATMIKHLYLMGGKYFDPVAEWNILCDVVAARSVFDSDAVIYALGLDVTSLVTMTREEAERTFSGMQDLLPVSDFIKVWFEHFDAVTFHDPLAAAAMLRNDICTFVRGNVNVDLAGEGITFFGKNKNGRHYVADSVCADKFFSEYFSRLS